MTFKNVTDKLRQMQVDAQKVPQALHNSAQEIVKSKPLANVSAVVHNTSTGTAITFKPNVGARVDSAAVSEHASSIAKELAHKSTQVARGALR